jgi:hypothetical protein
MKTFHFLSHFAAFGSTTYVNFWMSQNPCTIEVLFANLDPKVRPDGSSSELWITA